MKKTLISLFFVLSLFLVSCSSKQTILKNVSLSKLTEDNMIDRTIIIDKNSYNLYYKDVNDELVSVGIIRVMYFRFNPDIPSYTYDIKCSGKLAEKITLLIDTQELLVK